MTAYLFVCSRESLEGIKKSGVIGFLDSVSTLNNVLPHIQAGDVIFFYVTKERVIDGYAKVMSGLYWDDVPLEASDGRVLARRIKVSMKLNNLGIDFKDKIAPRLSFMSGAKKKKTNYGSYLVANLLKLTREDSDLIMGLLGQDAYGQKE